jgi:asparagine synthase (glutamine-hydrolysing)
MADVLAHRGPDDEGVFVDMANGLALAHRRLAVLDCSPAGHQPMVSVCGRYVISFNGEIYNHQKLREALEKQGQAPAWRGHADTETLLAAVAAWGVKVTLQACAGMFAFALWDREQRQLTLARDRLGEKPLYYGRMGEVFLFGSELKALRAHPDWQGKVDRNALALFLRHNCIPSPYSIYQGIRKLPPGTMLTVSADGVPSEPETYWSLRNIAEEGQKRVFPGGEEKAADALEELLKEVIGREMAADVPLGAFLSGGVDSSVVVALMQAQSRIPVKTFTIGFQEEEYNEAENAKAVARHLGTDHTELYVSPTEALAVIPRLPDLFDEPFADSSQIPTFLVSHLARAQVTVALSGDGGDEMFGGYTRHFWAQRVWRTVGWMPGVARRAIASMLTHYSPQEWSRVFNSIERWLPHSLRQTLPGEKLHKLADALSAETPQQLYQGLVSHWKQPAEVVLGAFEPPTLLTGPALELDNFVQQVIYLDTVSYLPDDILVKVDRAAMGVSLETRAPLLDHHVAEFAWSLPLQMKIRHGQGKWLLRQVLYRHVPRELVERPKMGFGVPISHWLRGPLRDWAENLLDEGRLRREGYFDPLPIRTKWMEHLSSQHNWQHHLWSVLMFQAWLERERWPSS